MSDPTEALAVTPLNALHRELGGKLVPFAGYEMPVQYPAGILKEHVHTRTLAGLFDVSHMGQVRLRGAGAAKALEADLCGRGRVMGERGVRRWGVGRPAVRAGGGSANSRSPLSLPRHAQQNATHRHPGLDQQGPPRGRARPRGGL